MPLESSVNILLVDDQPENLLALEALLEPLGENLVRAHSGAEALRCLLNQDFAVILLDVQMPDLDGFETATLIRNRTRSRQTPIIFLTAFSNNEQFMFKGYALGAVDYLIKPIDPAILNSKVAVFVDLFKKTEALRQQTERLKVMNAELRVTEERFRLLSTCSPVGVFITDTAGRCTYANPRFRDICGLSEAASLEQGWLPTVHPDDRERVAASWTMHLQEPEEYTEQFRFQTTHPDHYQADQHQVDQSGRAAETTARWGYVRSAPLLSDQGEMIGYVGTIEDITDQKQAEAIQAQIIREQAARQEAEASNRMKDEFLAILSHELRTPLNAMLGWSKLLRTRKYDESITHRALEIIERNATSQAQLIDDILDVSRIIRGKLQLNCVPTLLKPIAEAALNSVQPVAASKSIALIPQFETTATQVWGDSIRLQQIIWNLLTNAVKFTPEKGEVTLRLAVELLPDRLKQTLQIPSSKAKVFFESDRCAVIEVIDTGVGISAEFLPYVFERFRQADSTTTRSHSGLGLGLAIVRHLVEQHHGTIEVDSLGENQGAKFTVRLPLLQSTSPGSPAGRSAFGETESQSAPSRLDGLKVLVVDDEPDARQFLTFLLREAGANVTTADSVETALTALNAAEPDLLISDIGMPEQDGYSLIQQVRTRGSAIPAIALTAYSRIEDRTQILSAGFQQHLSKPIDPTNLLTEVTAIVTGKLRGKFSGKLAQA
ncbi:response regulator [Leptolyngbya sp. ST-U4]|uniref:hybrid sensor histidine kinase/response regulator n=2 Tax=unclassified Leptolyngbya TaxID=2650499 RepID=UPI0019BBA0E4|nr:response regulator [Cyanobacteria bacterium FACHB-502]